MSTYHQDDDFEEFEEFEEEVEEAPRPARKAPAKKAAKKAPAKKVSRIPANAPKPNDRKDKALTAREREAQGEGVEEVEIFGEIFAIDKDALKYSFDLHEGFSDGNGVKVVRGSLGTAGWEKLKAVAQRDHITVKDAIDGAAEAIAQAQGFQSAGN